MVADLCCSALAPPASTMNPPRPDTMQTRALLERTLQSVEDVGRETDKARKYSQSADEAESTSRGASEPAAGGAGSVDCR